MGSLVKFLMTSKSLDGIYSLRYSENGPTQLRLYNYIEVGIEILN